MPKVLAFGDKRDYKKIDIYVEGQYKATTTWSKTCKQAANVYRNAHNIPDNIKVTAHFQ